MNKAMSGSKFWGLITGYSIVLMAIAAGLAFGYIHDTVYIPNDPDATRMALRENTVLFQLGIASWVLVAILDVVVSIGIYMIYRSTHSKWAAMVALLRLIYTGTLFFAITQLVILLLNNEMKNGHVYFESFYKELLSANFCKLFYFQ